jgi:hypothetical protein
MAKTIFVFGSNEAGIHGAGAAKFAAKHYGAVRGQGRGFTGDCYAIPTKDAKIKTRPLDAIKKDVDLFISIATDEMYQDLQFNITKVGSGLAGYSWEKDIKPMFPNPLPTNCRFI